MENILIQNKSIIRLLLLILCFLLLLILLLADVMPLRAGDENDKKESGSGSFLPNTVMTISSTIINEAIKLDGIMEPVWFKGGYLGNFSETFPTENGAPKVNTEGYVIHDESNVYFTFICYDPCIQSLRASMTDRDQIYNDDRIGIIIDPYKDQQTGYEFIVNPFGIQGDYLMDINGNEDGSYDAVWYSECKVYEDRWVAEIRLPLKSLRFPDQPDQDWLLHVVRTYPRDNRYQMSWMPLSRNNNSFLSQAGHLQLAMKNTSQSKLELLPYVIGTANHTMSGNADHTGKWQSPASEASAGFNLKYGLSSTITTDFTFNPDFSQIEADAGQISINNTFALYNQERRPFFLEGSDIFGVSRYTFIYSRTINNPIVAGKITGKTGNLTFGYITAYDEDSPFILPSTYSSNQFATKWNSMTNIARAKYSIGDKSYVGIAASHRLYEKKGSNTAALVDANIRLSEVYNWRALAGFTRTVEPSDSALSADNISDLTIRTRGRSYTMAFDGETVPGWIMSSTFARNARYVNFNFNYDEVSPGFRADNSYIVYNQYRRGTGWAGYNFYFDKDNKFFQRVTPQVTVVKKWNFDGRLMDDAIQPGFCIQMQKQIHVDAFYFLTNNEYFRDKQFNGMHNGYIAVSSNTMNVISGGVFFLMGKQINRRGRPDDPHNPLALVHAAEFEVWGTFKPRSCCSYDFDFTTYKLWDHFGGKKISSQNIFRNTFAFQFTKRLFLRLISEMDLIDRYNLEKQKITRNTYFIFDPLVSYKINPFTVFYVGGHIGGSRDPYINRDGLQMTEQNVFMKFQYLLNI